MTTICISSFHPFISRNILRTPILSLLTASGVRIVIVMPESKKAYFQKEFEGNNVVLYPVSGNLSREKRSALFFKRLARAMFGVQMDFITSFEGGSPLRRLLKKIFFNYPASFFGHFRFARAFMRWCDYHLSRDPRFASLFENFKPQLIFSTDIQNENDVGLLKEAKKRKITTVSMVRSWDNIAVHGLFRILPHYLLVASEILKRDAHRYNDMPHSKIDVVGVPHYDRYLKGPTKGREEFFRSINADINKPLLLYTPIGDMYLKNNDVDPLVLEILSSFDANILVRLPPTDTVSLGDFKIPSNMFFYRPGVKANTDPKAGREVGRQEIGSEDDDHLINSMSFADVVICGPSTILIDAALFDRPIVAVGFDGPKERSHAEGVAQYYEYDYIRPVMDSGGVAYASNAPDCKRFISEYLDDPSKDEAGRRKIVELECSEVLGRASEKVADIVLELLK